MSALVTRHNHTVSSGVNLSYATAGNPSNPTFLLLHGFPTSNNQFRKLMPLLADKYYVVAPDLPHYGFTVVPEGYPATFENFANDVSDLLDHLKITSAAVYIFDYGAPTAIRIALKRPDIFKAVVTQNGNAYDDGFGEFWDPIKVYWNTKRGTPEFETAKKNLAFLLTLDTTKYQYTAGVPEDRLERLDPHTWATDFHLNLNGPKNYEAQLDLFYDYRTNVPLYPPFQKWMKDNKIPILVIWGKHDFIFISPGAEAFKKDLSPDQLRFKFIDGGHFVLETHLDEMVPEIRDFLSTVKF